MVATLPALELDLCSFELGCGSFTLITYHEARPDAPGGGLVAAFTPGYPVLIHIFSVFIFRCFNFFDLEY